LALAFVKSGSAVASNFPDIASVEESGAQGRFFEIDGAFLAKAKKIMLIVPLVATQLD
jgi:hypothetical protein